MTVNRTAKGILCGFFAVHLEINKSTYRSKAEGETKMETAMDTQEEYILICAPTKAGEHFIKLLIMKGARFAGLANNPAEKQRLAELG